MILRSAKPISFEWQPSSKPMYIERGPREKKPSSRATVYERKHNGRIVWRVFEDAKYILTVESEDAVLYEENVYSYIKDAFKNFQKDAKKFKITENFRKKFESYMQTQDFMVDDKGHISGLSKAIAVFVAEYIDGQS